MQPEQQLVLHERDRRLILGHNCLSGWQRQNAYYLAFQRDYAINTLSFMPHAPAPAYLLWLCRAHAAPHPLYCARHGVPFVNAAPCGAKVSFSFACTGRCFGQADLVLVLVELRADDACRWGAVAGHFRRAGAPADTELEALRADVRINRERIAQLEARHAELLALVRSLTPYALPEHGIF